jgi:hypothetical protein
VGTSRTGKGIWLWGLGLAVVVIALYAGGWFYAATLVRTNVLRALGQKSSAGVSAECADMSLGGFPFRIGLGCTKVSIDDHRNGVSASFSNLNASASVYAPGTIVWTVQSPAEIRTAQGQTISAEWTRLLSELQTRGKGIEQGSTVIEGLKAGIVSSLAGQRVDLSAARTEIHARQNGADLEATIGIENANAVIKDFPQPLPTLSASADMTLTGGAAILAGGETGESLHGTSGILNHIVADIGDGRTMKLSGPFSIDDQGLISGQFKLEIDQLGPWRDSLKLAVPAASRTIDFAGKLLKGLASGGDSVTVNLTADHGAVSLSGFIPIGRIPPM